MTQRRWMPPRLVIPTQDQLAELRLSSLCHACRGSTQGIIGFSLDVVGVYHRISDDGLHTEYARFCLSEACIENRHSGGWWYYMDISDLFSHFPSRAPR